MKRLDRSVDAKDVIASEMDAAAVIIARIRATRRQGHFGVAPKGLGVNGGDFGGNVIRWDAMKVSLPGSHRSGEGCAAPHYTAEVLAGHTSFSQLVYRDLSDPLQKCDT